MALWLKAILDSVLPLVMAVGLVSGEYLGCYQDSGGANRLMSEFLLEFQTNTPRRCTNLCTKLGYRFAGVQDGDQCFCGNKEPSEDRRISELVCNIPCPGNSNELCGGGLKSSVYSGNSSPSPEAVYMGCYEDYQSRLLSDFRFRWDEEFLTPKKCINLCKSFGFPYAGLEVGVECWCGKQRPSDSMKKNESDCNYICPHTKYRCGSHWRLSVYTFPVDIVLQLDISDATVEKSYLGCYEDGENRILPDAHFYLLHINTPKKCIYICKQLGFDYAGVENVNGCHCGYERPAPGLKKNDNECNMPCPQKVQMCGAEWRMGLYSIDNK